MPRHLHRLMLAAAFLLTAAVYWPGLSGGYLFDDYPNIVDNAGVQPHEASVPSLVRAALSSPSSEFKRPLASLSFAVNYLATGIDPYWMKLTNLIIHLLNGWVVFFLCTSLLAAAQESDEQGRLAHADAHPLQSSAAVQPLSAYQPVPSHSLARERVEIVAALVATGWMLLPINLTAVLYVVQRMESMANLFVLVGLTGYVAARRRMIASEVHRVSSPSRLIKTANGSSGLAGFFLCALSVTVPTAIGLLAKETAVMLPLYAFLVEGILFRFRKPSAVTLERVEGAPQSASTADLRIVGLFGLVLALPLVIGLIWLLPQTTNAAYWSSRDFTLATRLLSEARIVADYIVWTLLPTPAALSFYHDDFQISTGLLAPWTTALSAMSLLALATLAWSLRERRPLVTLGIALYLASNLLTGTVLPLELVYEHRNYFASFGLLLGLVPLLAVPTCSTLALPRRVLFVGLILSWTTLTALTAYAWGNPLRLAEELASRAPDSPRAEYELGRTYIIYSHYDQASPFTKLAYAPLERAGSLPRGSILPEQALIFMNSRMHLPLKNAWWDSLIAKLKLRRPGVQDESSLQALTQCAQEHRCDLPKTRMVEAFMAALSHPDPSARLLAIYGDYAWNVLGDHTLGERMLEEAVKASPDEPAYLITWIRMLAAQGHGEDAAAALKRLAVLNVGGRLDSSLLELRRLPGIQ